MAAKGISFSNSGLDVEQMVTLSMKPYQMKYDSLFKKKELEVWRNDSYNTLFKALKEYQTSLSDFKRQGTLSKRLAASTNASAVTATASGDATLMTHNISDVKLARNATLQTIDGKKASEYLDSSSNVQHSTDLATLSKLTQADLDAKIAAGDGGQIALSFDVGDGGTVSTVKYTYQQLKDGKTLNDFASDIKSKGLNLTANYDATNDSFSVTNKKTGAANKISLATADINSENLLRQLNMGQYGGGAGTTNTTPAPITSGDINVIGTDATAVIDGNTYTSAENSIDVNGVRYTLNNNMNPGDTVNISISQDNESIVKSVQKFVDSYNTLLEKLNDQIYTARPTANKKTFDPLTDEEKKGMSEDDLKNWETKGKTGLLYHDNILSTVVNSMRTALSTPNMRLGYYDPVTQKNVGHMTASSIGINLVSGKDSWSQHGKLELNTEDLMKALEEDPDSVYELIGSQRAALDSNGDVRKDAKGNTIYEDSEQGLAYRLEGAMKKAIENVGGQCEESRSTGALQGESGYLPGKIFTMEQSLANMLQMMQQKETDFYRKFNAMEQAVGNLQNSLGALSGIMG